MRFTTLALLFASTAVGTELAPTLWDWEVYGFDGPCPKKLEDKNFHNHHKDNLVSFGDKGESKNCQGWASVADGDYNGNTLLMRGFEANGLELEIYGHGGCEKDTQIMKLHTDGCTVVPKDTPLEWYSVRKV